MSRQLQGETLEPSLTNLFETLYPRLAAYSDIS